MIALSSFWFSSTQFASLNRENVKIKLVENPLIYSVIEIYEICYFILRVIAYNSEYTNTLYKVVLATKDYKLIIN